MTNPPQPATTALTIAKRYTGPALGGLAAGALSYHGGAAALGHLVEQIGFAEALVCATVAGTGGLIWATGRTVAGWIEATAAKAMPRVDAFLSDINATARHGAATAQLLQAADSNAREERAGLAQRVEELADQGQADHADLAEGLRRCEAYALEAAQEARAANAHAARAAATCEAMARKFDLELSTVIPPAPAPPVNKPQEA